MADELLENFFKGDTRALSRVITRVENRSADSLPILQQLFPHSGKAKVIGVTGSPGSGKSTLVDRLAAFYKGRNDNLAIVAVDPSSPFTGGAILGDRIRMQTPGVYIRSMATRGHLGGLATATADVVTVLDAAGKDPILVETVGVGQDEIDIVKLADISLVVLVPGMGDDIQALKAGIMEIGDIFVINKCDRPGVEKMERAVLAMLSLAHRADGWQPPVVKTVATRGEGIDELAETIEKAYSFFQTSGHKTQKKHDAARQRLITLLQERLVNTALQQVFADGELNKVIDQITNRHQDPYTIVDEIVRNSELKRHK
ncbi:MAG TPA: methylmalonyl Co-A mutase-associated GTPase MeaB [Terriglobia bacterium]|nr:methylmalonyl Co-A mutase-associated GTPase MeaB [Terriglobia bacterium]